MGKISAWRLGMRRRTILAMDKLTAKPSIREGNERVILAAAEALFAERGFGGATMAEIAARAGMPKPNVHYYFPTKVKLYRAVI